MKIFIVNSEEKKDVREQLQEAKDWIDGKDSHPEPTTDEPEGPPYGIVLTGQALVCTCTYVPIFTCTCTCTYSVYSNTYTCTCTCNTWSCIMC